METKIIEAVSTEGNHGKFLIGRFDDEHAREQVGGGPLISRRWGFHHLLVVDLETGEGAIFQPGGHSANDLEKHRVWVCPMFEPFLGWLYGQDVTDLQALPDVVTIDGVPLQMRGYRRPGPGEPETSR